MLLVVSVLLSLSSADMLSFFSISVGLSLLLLVSASVYASAFTDAYGLLAGSNPKTSRFDRPGLGWWIEFTLNCVITAAMDAPPFYLFLLTSQCGDGLFNPPPIGSDSLFFTFSSRHDPGIQASRSNHGFSSPTLGEASESVGGNAVMPGGLKSSGRWHRLTYNKSTLAFLVSLCLLVEAPVCSHLRKM